MEKGKVSIIVPCYKQAEYLPETLDSVLAQTYLSWECIIVNDGSPDNTDDIAKAYLEKDDRFKYFYQENHGLATARNNGIVNSTGEYILPLDADDLIEPTYIERAVLHFIEFPETKLVYCKASFFGEETGPWNLPYFQYNEFIWRNCIFNSAIYRRSDYYKTAGYNPNMIYGYEDWDFWLSLLSPNDIVFRIDKVLFRYRIKRKSLSTETHNHHNELCKQIYKNHPQIYEPFASNIISIQNDLLYYKQLYINLKNSPIEKLLRFISNPTRIFHSK